MIGFGITEGTLATFFLLIGLVIRVTSTLVLYITHRLLRHFDLKKKSIIFIVVIAALVLIWKFILGKLGISINL